MIAWLWDRLRRPAVPDRLLDHDAIEDERDLREYTTHDDDSNDSTPPLEE